MVAELCEKGWALFLAEPALRDWADEARLAALARIADPAQRAQWLQCEGPGSSVSIRCPMTPMVGSARPTRFRARHGTRRGRSTARLCDPA